MQFAAVWYFRQSTLDCIGRDVKVGVLVRRDGVVIIEHDQRLLDNHRPGILDKQAGIIDAASFL